MNTFHRYLDLPFEIEKPDICNTTPTENFHMDLMGVHAETGKANYKDLNMWMFHDMLGLEINHVEVFYTAAGSTLPIHADTTVINNRVKINITWGPKEGKIRWWKAKNTMVKADVQNDGKTHRAHKNVRANIEDCEFLFEANTNWPSLVNVGQLHDTYSPENSGRWTLCFVPQVKGSGDKCLFWDDAIKYYKNYII